MKKEKLDFEKLDNMWNFNYKSDLLNIITGPDYEYKYISEFVYELYYTRKKCVREISEILKLAKYTVVMWMHRWEFQARKPGGRNNKKYINDPDFVEKIISLKGKMEIVDVEKEYNCSRPTIKKMWNGTHCSQI